MKKLGAAVLACAVVWLFILSGCSKPQPEQTTPQIVVGYVELLSESPWRDEVTRSISEAAAQQDIKLITVEAQRTQESQIQAMRTLVTYQVDAIVLSPVVMSGWDNVLGEAKAASIPVITVERRIKTELKTGVAAHIGSDYEWQGAQAARFVRETFAHAEETVHIMELRGTVGSSTSAERSRGIRSVLDRQEQFDIYYSVSCDGMFSKAKETFGIFLNNNQRPDILIAYNDAMALGAIEAIEQAGLMPGKDIVIISFDAQQQALNLLGEGKINCEIETNPALGPPVMAAVLALAGEETPADVVLQDAVYVEGDDISGLPPRGY